MTLLRLSKQEAAEKEFPCSLACEYLTPMTQRQVLGTSVMAGEHAQLVTDPGWLPGAHATLPATPEPVLSWIQLPTATLTFSSLLPSGQGVAGGVAVAWNQAGWLRLAGIQTGVGGVF